MFEFITVANMLTSAMLSKHFSYAKSVQSGDLITCVSQSKQNTGGTAFLNCIGLENDGSTEAQKGG